VGDSKAIDFGRQNRMGNVRISGDVAGHDIVKIAASPDMAADVQSKQQLLELVALVRADIAKLADAPAGEREDVADELRKAEAAAQQGDQHRLVEKLEGARRILEVLGGSIPAALTLAQTVGALVQKAAGLS
jgi:hypothetical protein